MQLKIIYFHTNTKKETESMLELKIKKQQKNTPTGREIQSDKLSGWLKVIQSNTDTSLQPQYVCGGDRGINLHLEVKLVKSG